MLLDFGGRLMVKKQDRLVRIGKIMLKKQYENERVIDIMFRTALLTQARINQYFARNKSSLSILEFMRMQEESYSEARERSRKESKEKK